jgi:hypothetical protein
MEECIVPAEVTTGFYPGAYEPGAEHGSFGQTKRKMVKPATSGRAAIPFRRLFRAGPEAGQERFL